MASYAVVRQSDVATGSGDVVAVVVTDGQKTIVYPPDDDVGLSDVDWPTGDPDDVLVVGLANLYYFDVDGPHSFEGDADESGPAVAAIYGLSTD